jgi:hypothetical protein
MLCSKPPLLRGILSEFTACAECLHGDRRPSTTSIKDKHYRSGSCRFEDLSGDRLIFWNRARVTREHKSTATGEQAENRRQISFNTEAEIYTRNVRRLVTKTRPFWVLYAHR